MICSFFFTPTQKTTIRELPSSFLKPVKSKHPPPRSLPSKERNLGWNIIHLNTTWRKSNVIGIGQQAVSIFDPKLSVSSSLPKNWVFLQRGPVTPQNIEQVPYHIQLPIIITLKNLRFQLPWPKFWSPISSTVAFLWEARANRWGKFWDSVVPVHQTSVQNLILVPFLAMSTMLSQHQSVSFKISF